MAEPATKKPNFDLSQNKANVMLRKAAEGKYAIPGVCVVSLDHPTYVPLATTTTTINAPLPIASSHNVRSRPSFP